MKHFLIIVFMAIGILAFNKQVEATTHYVQIGVSTPNYCVNPLALDTFIILKPVGYGTTQWYLDFVPQGVHDSLIFIGHQSIKIIPYAEIIK